MSLVGKAIRLRHLKTADAPLLHEWNTDPEFGGYYVETPLFSAERWENLIRESWNLPDRNTYLIERRESGELVGLASSYAYSQLPWMHGFEIGYEVHPNFRRQGIATQAACLLINHLFDTEAVNRVQATVTVGNEPSCLVLERAGMQREGVMRGTIWLHGAYRGLYLYSILRSDWGDEERYRAGRPDF